VRILALPALLRRSFAQAQQAGVIQAIYDIGEAHSSDREGERSGFYDLPGNR